MLITKYEENVNENRSEISTYTFQNVDDKNRQKEQMLVRVCREGNPLGSFQPKQTKQHSFY